MRFKNALRQWIVTPEIEERLVRVPRRVGSLGYDPWGYNADAMAITLTLVEQLYKHYFRVRATGLENVPADGPVLVIANHAGQLPMDGIMLGYSLTTSELSPRIPRSMIERFFPTVPWIGNLMNQIGGVIGDPTNCGKMLERGEAVIVFPEGVRGSGKPYRKRYQLQRFGHGFAHLAMHYNAPVVPVGIVGSEETMPALGSFDPLAKLLGLPYFPIGPLLPLPARMYLNFGPPMYFGSEFRDEGEVAAHVEEVKAMVGSLIEKGFSQRERAR